MIFDNVLLPAPFSPVSATTLARMDVEIDIGQHRCSERLAELVDLQQRRDLHRRAPESARNECDLGIRDRRQATLCGVLFASAFRATSIPNAACLLAN